MRTHQQWFWVSLLAAILSLADCGLIPAAPLKTYPGEELPDDQVATLDWCGWDKAEWDIVVDDEIFLDIFKSRVRGEDRSNFWSGLCQAKILPGTHTIKFEHEYVDSGIVVIAWYRIQRSVTLELLPGHTYYFEANSKDDFWIENEDGNRIYGEVVRRTGTVFPP